MLEKQVLKLMAGMIIAGSIGVGFTGIDSKNSENIYNDLTAELANYKPELVGESYEETTENCLNYMNEEFENASNIYSEYLTECDNFNFDWNSFVEEVEEDFENV